jgi:pyruvate dehydrogenase E1 component beta subunit
MKTAIRDDNPVLFFESETLYSVKGDVPDDRHLDPWRSARRVAREGTDCTIVAWSRMVHVSLEAAELLEKEGISCEVIDLRSLRPLDEEATRASVRKTHRAWSRTRAGPTAASAPRSSTASSASPSTSSTPPSARNHFLDVPMPYNAKLEQT